MPSARNQQNIEPQTEQSALEAEVCISDEEPTYRYYVKRDHKNHIYNAEHRVISLKSDKGMIVDIYI